MKEVLPLMLRLLIREDLGGKGAQSGTLSPLLLVLWMHLGAGAVGESRGCLVFVEIEGSFGEQLLDNRSELLGLSHW